MGLLTNFAAKIDNAIRKKTTTRSDVGADAKEDAKLIAAMSSKGMSPKAKEERGRATEEVMKEISPVRSAVVEAGKTTSAKAASNFAKGAMSLATSMQKKFTEIAGKSSGSKSSGNSGLPPKSKVNSGNQR